MRGRIEGIFMLRALVFVGLFGCASLPTQKAASGEVSRTLLINGSPLTITLNEPSLNSQAVDRLFKQLQREAAAIDATFFATGSLELINNELAKSKGPIRISPRSGQMIADAMRGYELTGGVFDPTVGPLIRAWIAMKGEQPSPSAIREAMTKTGADKLILSRDLKTLSTQVVGMRLEPGGLRDGWVVKRISEILRERRLINFFVNFRGACWYASGLAADGRPWRVLINDHHTRRAGLVYLENESLSISVSLVPRPDGKPGSKGHIVDPRNGFLVQESRSVAAIAPSPLDAEILSTATVVLGSQAGDAVRRVEGGSVIIFYGESKKPLMLGVSPKFERVKGLDHGTYFEGERASR
jgi:thiamine biosynthesis lipoprotein